MEELKTMQSVSNSFDSTTGKKLYFDTRQDVVPAYDLMNLNVSRCYIFIGIDV